LPREGAAKSSVELNPEDDFWAGFGFPTSHPDREAPARILPNVATDGERHNWSCIASEESFPYVREMQRKYFFVPLAARG
jgi:hypothetical protein